VAVAAAVLVAAIVLGGCAGRREQTLVFFYETYCPSCEISVLSEQIASQLLWRARNEQGLRVETHNVSRAGPEAYQKLGELLRERGRSLIDTVLPVLVTDEAVYSGLDEVMGYLESVK